MLNKITLLFAVVMLEIRFRQVCNYIHVNNNEFYMYGNCELLIYCGVYNV